MHQLLDKMQALMGKHRDAPVMLEAEPAPLPSTDGVSEATPFPVLTDIVRRGEILADAPPVTPQPLSDFTAEIASPAGVTVNFPEAFTRTGQSGPFTAALATPVLTDIVRYGEVLAETSPDALQATAPGTPAQIAHLAATADGIPEAFTSPEQAELLATAVATHVLGMIDGHLMYEVNTVMAQRLRRVVDDTLSTLLTQLALDIESIVREAVAEELARHGIHPANTPENPSNPV
ncbi:hypothetical protein TPL01_03360 [Sulfuriferula plumbiphila]|uniref:Uncharacterized protein n=2 Tax=Sulfuriferula plumbiphila TaxID=171865 RepID=A0A512L400_9PROT|nr:hypothetical protein TPL01_03360 [Sulfuriferula plumbiphila]